MYNSFHLAYGKTYAFDEYTINVIMLGMGNGRVTYSKIENLMGYFVTVNDDVMMTYKVKSKITPHHHILQN